MEPLTQYRKDKATWDAVAYAHAKDKEYGDFDTHKNARYKTLLALQYDLQS